MNAYHTLTRRINYRALWARFNILAPTIVVAMRDNSGDIVERKVRYAWLARGSQRREIVTQHGELREKNWLVTPDGARYVVSDAINVTELTDAKYIQQLLQGEAHYC